MSLLGSLEESKNWASVVVESVIGLYKTECIKLDGPFKTVDEVELATLM